jgi:hypothetical protein
MLHCLSTLIIWLPTHKLAWYRRANIQEWAADELLSPSLADLLSMSDCLNAGLLHWEHVMQALVLKQSLPMGEVCICCTHSPAICLHIGQS